MVPIKNDYQIYEQLCKISSIASLYPNGQAFADKTQETADRIASQLYPVAVMGEFKRGKSSLVNALLGTDVLPTDILPMTAVITRVAYGENQKISVRYKDGHTEERTLEQLIDFATKYDEARAETAKSIQEIQVSYPSVFCKNHIEIIDTPGMNDEEAMSAVTLSVLGEIDAAVMVVSATAPLSMTEQNLILTMIAEQSIHHIVFVITHIDVVSDEDEEKERLISFFGDRIRGDLLQNAEAEFVRNKVMSSDLGRIIFLVNKIDLIDEDDRPRLLSSIREKIQSSVLGKMEIVYGKDSKEYQSAKDKIGEIRLLPVSAKKALKGKLKNDAAMLADSGYTEFEAALSKLLTEERGMLELIHPVNQLLSAGQEAMQTIETRLDALAMSTAEFEAVQKDSIEKIEEN